MIGRGAATASLGSVALRARARARALARLTTPPPTRCSCAPLLRQGTVGPVVHGAARTDTVLRRHGRLSGVRAPVLPCRPTPRALAAGVLHLKPSIDLTQQTLLLLATRHLLKSRRRRRSVLLEFTNSTPNRSLHPPHRRLHSLSTRPPSLGVRVPRPLQHPHRGRHRHLSSSVSAVTVILVRREAVAIDLLGPPHRVGTVAGHRTEAPRRPTHTRPGKLCASGGSRPEDGNVATCGCATSHLRYTVL